MIFLPFSCFILTLNEAWQDDDVFGPSSNGPTATNELLYITGCLFEGCSGGQNGGAVYYSDIGKGLIEVSTFNQCHSLKSGGVIYCEGYDFVIKKCCGTKCYSVNQYAGQFVYTRDQYPTKTCINRVLDSSIAHSMIDFDNPSETSTLTLQHGTIKMSIVNISNNACDSSSALYTYQGSTTPCAIEFTSFNGNRAKDTIINLYTAENTAFTITYTNILQNIESEFSGLITTAGSATFSNTCVMNNSAFYIFATEKNGYFSFFNCSFDYDPNKNIGSTKVIESALNSFINPIVFTKKENYCYATLDSTFNNNLKPTQSATQQNDNMNCKPKTCNPCDIFDARPKIDLYNFIEYIFLLCALPTNIAQ